MTTDPYPFIHIEQRPDPVDPTGYQLNIKAGDGIESTDHIVTVLLLVVKQITGVSPELYAREIDMVRRLAGGGSLFGAEGDDDDH